MVTSKAASVKEYLAELPDDRRAAIEAVRTVILQHLPVGYEEVMQYGMIFVRRPVLARSGHLQQAAARDRSHLRTSSATWRST